MLCIMGSLIKWQESQGDQEGLYSSHLESRMNEHVVIRFSSPSLIPASVPEKKNNKMHIRQSGQKLVIAGVITLLTFTPIHGAK